MSFFIKRKLKDGRQIRGRHSYSTNKVIISRDDFEGLLDESDVAYEQAKQLQVIIENLQEIKAESVRRTLDKIRAEIERRGGNDEKAFCKSLNESYKLGLREAIDIIDKYKAESEE